MGDPPPLVEPRPAPGPRARRPDPGACPPDRAMVVSNCWHTLPVFRLTVRVLQDPDHENHMTALVFFTEVSSRGWGAGGCPSGSSYSGGPWPDSRQAGRRCSGPLGGHLESQALSFPGETESRL